MIKSRSQPQATPRTPRSQARTLKSLVLRSYPRVIKRGRHNSYRVKKPGDHGTRHHGPPTIRLANPVNPQLAA